jgi:hypothetical protein
MLGLSSLFNALLGIPLAARIGLAVVLVAALGVPMGTLLPLGVRTASSYGGEMVPWAWGINGGASVLGSSLAVVLSMHFGFSATLLAGVLTYAAGALVLRVARGQAASEAGEVRAAA